MFQTKRLLLIAIFMAMLMSAGYAQSENVILEIDDEKITLEEYKRIYFKNNKDSALTRESLEEYLELFTNFKLKVHEAEQLGLDEHEKFKKELATYRKQLVKPYLTDSATDEKLIREAYNHMQHIVRANHILFKIPQKATPEDTLEIYNEAKAVLNKIKDGADFNQMAKKHSQDPSVRYNEGDLGYFSAFKMVYPFEKVAFSLNEGEVSDLVRTRFGYHIIKVKDKKKAPGKVKAAHIMVRLPKNATNKKKTTAKAKIDSIYKKLQDGAEFSTVARQHSEDPQTAKKGGELPEFTPGRMLPSFEAQIFSLENGTYSEPFKTKVGWHIVKKISNKPVKPLKKERANIKRKLSKTARANLSRKKVVQKLRKEYNLEKNQENLDKLYSAIQPDSLMKGKFVLSKEIDEAMPVISFADTQFAAADLIKYIKKSMQRPKTSAAWFLEKRTTNFIDKKIINYEKAHLEEKYPDFAFLMKEYHDGILLFNITDSVVWKKAVKDTAGLKAYFNEHRNDYQWKKRMQSDIIEVKPLPRLKKTRKIIAKAYKKEQAAQIESKLRDQFNDSTITVKIDSGKYEKGTNRYVDQTKWKTGLFLGEELNDGAVFVYNHQILDPQPKALDEVRGMVTADYQNYLEQKWIKQLKEKYDVKKHPSLLDQLLD